ncbi:MAG: succinate dehydrogenase, cytochrome b556 subunit, partial [uncultured bacterium]
MERPVHLNLFRMSFPPMAIVSILHRISGVLIFLLLPLALHLLYQSLQSHSSFMALKQSLTSPCLLFFVWILICAAGFHLLAGIRHMFMDCGYGESLVVARVTAYVIFFLAIIL